MGPGNPVIAVDLVPSAGQRRGELGMGWARAVCSGNRPRLSVVRIRLLQASMSEFFGATDPARQVSPDGAVLSPGRLAGQRRVCLR